MSYPLSMVSAIALAGLLTAITAAPAGAQVQKSCGCYCGEVLPPPCSDAACKKACEYSSGGGSTGNTLHDYGNAGVAAGAQFHNWFWGNIKKNQQKKANQRRLREAQRERERLERERQRRAEERRAAQEAEERKSRLLNTMKGGEESVGLKINTASALGLKGTDREAMTDRQFRECKAALAKTRETLSAGHREARKKGLTFLADDIAKATGAGEMSELAELKRDYDEAAEHINGAMQAKADLKAFAACAKRDDWNDCMHRARAKMSAAVEAWLDGLLGEGIARAKERVKDANEFMGGYCGRLEKQAETNVKHAASCLR